MRRGEMNAEVMEGQRLSKSLPKLFRKDGWLEEGSYYVDKGEPAASEVPDHNLTREEEAREVERIFQQAEATAAGWGSLTPEQRRAMGARALERVRELMIEAKIARERQR